MGTGTNSQICTSYQNPQLDACIPYSNTPSVTGTRPLNISNVLLPGTKVGLMLDYDYENGNFAAVSNQVANEDGTTVGSSGSTDYTDGSTYSLTGIINSNLALKVTFTNLNTQGTENGQFIQYRQPSSISARTRTSTLRNRTNGTIRTVQDTIVGSNWYGCSAAGWNVSLRGIVPDELLTDPGDNVTNNNNTSDG